MSDPLRFGADRRLRRRGEFDRVFARGVRARRRGFTVVVLRGTGPRSRIGISVGRRFGNAVERNRVKRLFRESFRLDQHRIPAGLDIVVIPYPELRGARLRDLRGGLLGAICRAAGRPSR